MAGGERMGKRERERGHHECKEKSISSLLVHLLAHEELNFTLHTLSHYKPTLKRESLTSAA